MSAQLTLRGTVTFPNIFRPETDSRMLCAECADSWAIPRSSVSGVISETSEVMLIAVPANVSRPKPSDKDIMVGVAPPRVATRTEW